MLVHGVKWGEILKEGRVAAAGGIHGSKRESAGVGQGGLGEREGGNDRGLGVVSSLQSGGSLPKGEGRGALREGGEKAMLACFSCARLLRSPAPVLWVRPPPPPPRSCAPPETSSLSEQPESSRSLSLGSCARGTAAA